MAREIIRPASTTRMPTTSPSSRIATSGRLLTAPRSSRYLQAMRKLDAHAALSPLELDEVIDTIRREFEEKWAATPLGLVATCYLGHPFETHVLALDGRIVEHYQQGQTLPGEFDRARSSAKEDLYEFVEVYRDKLICVRADGTTVTLEG